MAVLCAFSIAPGGGDAVAPDGSVGPVVAEVVRVIRQSGLPNETNAMFTNVEGSWDEVVALLGRCVEVVEAASPRVSLVAKFDIRTGHEGALIAKVDTVERLLAGD